MMEIQNKTVSALKTDAPEGVEKEKAGVGVAVEAGKKGVQHAPDKVKHVASGAANKTRQGVSALKAYAPEGVAIERWI